MNEASDNPDLAAFRAHMGRCVSLVRAPLSPPDIKVTIIVRLPEGLPSEAMITTDDDLSVVRDTLAYFAKEHGATLPGVNDA